MQYQFYHALALLGVVAMLRWLGEGRHGTMEWMETRAHQRVVERALTPASRADRVVRRLSRAPAVMDRLVDVTGDLAGPASLLSPRLLSTFLYPPAPVAR